MSHVALREIVERVTPRLRELDDSSTAIRSAPGKWSKKEILGHLADSAANNHRRFVLAQLQDDLVFPGYDQDRWVRAQRYDKMAWTDIVDLWRSFNLHVARVMESTPADLRVRPYTRHNFHEIGFRPVPADEPATLGWFMNDYLDHLKHHLRQILAPGAVE